MFSNLPKDHPFLKTFESVLKSETDKMPETVKIHKTENLDGEPIKKKIKNIDTNIKDDGNGRTPLHYAAEKGFVRIVELLLEFGSDVNAKDYQEQTPLHCAAEHKNLTLLPLLKSGSNVHLKDVHGKTALHYAVINKAVIGCHLLLKFGSDVNAKDNNGKTPLHYAAENGATLFFEYLHDLFQAKEERAQDVEAKKEDKTEDVEAKKAEDVPIEKKEKVLKNQEEYLFPEFVIEFDLKEKNLWIYNELTKFYLGHVEDEKNFVQFFSRDDYELLSKIQEKIGFNYYIFLTFLSLKMVKKSLKQHLDNYQCLFLHTAKSCILENLVSEPVLLLVSKSHVHSSPIFGDYKLLRKEEFDNNNEIWTFHNKLNGPFLAVILPRENSQFLKDDTSDDVLFNFKQDKLILNEKFSHELADFKLDMEKSPILKKYIKEI